MTFRQRVIEYIKKIPKGKVVSYGQVAAAAGSPRAPRQVGSILRSLDIIGSLNLGKGVSSRKPERTKRLSAAKVEGNIVPWWRVVNNQGIISIKGNWTATKELQRDLLIKDGVKIDSEFKINIDKYRY